MEVKILNLKDSSNIDIDKYPDKCPFCHRSIHPEYITGLHRNFSGYSSQLEIIFRCPAEDCRRIFISYYRFISTVYGNKKRYNYDTTMFGYLKPLNFSDVIKSISDDYCKIFREALAAEQWGLGQICGVGYRKSLEFLIKDYLIKIKNKDEAIIKSKFLGKCIEEDIENVRIKEVAKRAAWLGNDETHYFKKWEDKDLTNLKDLIKLTVNWIEDEHLSDKYKNDMPGK